MAKTILVVDDEEYIGRALQRVLVKAGYAVFYSKTAEHAFEILDKDPVDLCLTDLALPGTSGIDLMRMIRESEKHAELPVIVQTGFAQQQAIRDQIIPFGPRKILAKPVLPDDLLLAIREGLGEPHVSA